MTSEDVPGIDRLEDKLRSWVETNSGSQNRDGLNRMANLLAAELAGLPGDLERLEIAPVHTLDEGRVTPGDALRFQFRRDAPIQVLFSGHMDTVYGPDSPFQKLEKLPNGTWRGPGITDMKGGLMVMIEAVRRFLERDQYGTLGGEILITADEEIGSPGSFELLAGAARQHHIGLVFESALPGGHVILRRKGGGAFRLLTHGRAAHSGRDFASGRNAIVAMADAICVLHAINDSEPGIILNIARVCGGDALNVVPDLAALSFHVRVEEPQQVDRVQTVLGNALNYLTGRHPDIKFALQGGITRVPRIESPACRKLLEVWQRAEAEAGFAISEPRPSGGGSDGNILGQFGLPHLDGIGVHGGNIHSSDEFMIPESLPMQIAKTVAFLDMISANNPLAAKQPSISGK